MGIAFSCRRTEGLVTEPHDIPMDIIVTEKEVITADNVAVFNSFGARE